jgi:hemoglobin
MNISKLPTPWLLAVLAASHVYAIGAPASPTLFERLGGMEKISAAANEIVENVSHDARTSRSFEGVNLKPLKVSVASHLCAVAAGPCAYRGENMTVAHTGLAITADEFRIMGGYVEQAFLRQGVAPTDLKELLQTLEHMQAEVVGK